MALACRSRLALFNEIYHINSRCLCYRVYSNKPDNKHGKVTKPEIKPGKVGTYAAKKYISYMEKIGDRLEQKYPKVYKLYRLVKEGMREFFNDTKMYLRVSSGIWAGRTLDSFSRLELENYRQFPRELLRASPTVVLLNIPILDMITPFFAYFFPRHLLCRHFWTTEQRLKFGLFYLNRRIHHYPHVLSYLHKHSSHVRDVGKRKTLHDILDKVKHGSQPSVGELVQVKHLFTKRPFGLDHLSKMHRIHMWHIAKSLNYSTRKTSLLQSALLLHNIDLAISREGVKSMSLEHLQQSCFSRGLNAVGVERTDLEDYLHQWTSLSKQLDEGSLSLLLHAPVLLAYNRPSNKKYLLKNVDVTKEV